MKSIEKKFKHKESLKRQSTYNMRMKIKIKSIIFLQLIFLNCIIFSSAVVSADCPTNVYPCNSQVNIENRNTLSGSMSVTNVSEYIQNWSQYPAVSDVDINGNDIQGVSQIDATTAGLYEIVFGGGSPLIGCNAENEILQVTSGGDLVCGTREIANNTFWRLDGTNAPPTADWNMGNRSFTNIRNISFISTSSQPVSSIDFQNTFGGDIKNVRIIQATKYSVLDNYLRFENNSNDLILEFIQDGGTNQWKFYRDVDLNNNDLLNIGSLDIQNITGVRHINQDYDEPVQIGVDSTHLQKANARDILWVVSRRPATQVRTATIIGEYNGSSNVNAPMAALNSFFYTTASSNGTLTAPIAPNGGVVGGRYAVRHGGSGNITNANGVASQISIIQDMDGFIQNGTAFLAERPVGGGTGGIDIYRGLWVMDGTGNNIKEFVGVDIENISIATNNYAIRTREGMISLGSRNITLSNIPSKSATSSDWYLCVDSSGMIFKNETGCHI